MPLKTNQRKSPGRTQTSQGPQIVVFPNFPRFLVWKASLALKFYQSILVYVPVRARPIISALQINLADTDYRYSANRYRLKFDNRYR